MAFVSVRALKQLCPEDFPGKNLLIEKLTEYHKDVEDPIITQEIIDSLKASMLTLKNITIHLYTNEKRFFHYDDGYSSIPIESRTRMQSDKFSFLEVIVKLITNAWSWDSFIYSEKSRNYILNGFEKMVENFQTAYQGPILYEDEPEPESGNETDADETDADENNN